MITKRILVLANSVRHFPARCVAGREIGSGPAGRSFGPWVRPLSGHGDGELLPAEIALNDGSEPRVLDVIEMYLDSPRNDPFQPENWNMVRYRRWRRIGRATLAEVAGLEEFPADLWLEPGRKIQPERRVGFQPARVETESRAFIQSAGTAPSIQQAGWKPVLRAEQRNDRIAHEVLKRLLPIQSLYLIRPQSLRIRVTAEDDPWSDRPHYKRRALFTYKGIAYDFSITDPVFDAKYADRFPKIGQPALEFPLAGGNNCLLCVSLAREYRGHHYKIAATIIEL